MLLCLHQEFFGAGVSAQPESLKPVAQVVDYEEAIHTD
jgi:hypothetical protein